MWSIKTGGLFTQVNYGTTCSFGGLKRQAFNTGGLKDRLLCIITASLQATCDTGCSTCGVHFHR